MNGLVLILGASGASATLWAWQNRKLLAHRRRHRAYMKTLDANTELVIEVANHDATARHHRLSSLHVLYGLLQLDVFTAAIEKLGGDVKAIEQRVHDQLEIGPGDPEDVRPMLTRAGLVASEHGRLVSYIDVWFGLSRTKPAELLGDLSPRLLFALVHGRTESITEVPQATVVHVVLRNDDYTSREFVVEIVRDLFGASEHEAVELMKQTHDQGRAVIGRLEVAAAHQKLEAASARARDLGFPLWVGAEAC